MIPGRLERGINASVTAVGTARCGEATLPFLIPALLTQLAVKNADISREETSRHG